MQEQESELVKACRQAVNFSFWALIFSLVAATFSTASYFYMHGWFR